MRNAIIECEGGTHAKASTPKFLHRNKRDEDEMIKTKIKEKITKEMEPCAMHVRYFTPFVSGTGMIAIVVWRSSVVGSTFSHLMPQLCTKAEKQPLGWFDTEFTSKSKVYATKKKRRKTSYVVVVVVVVV